MYAENFLMETFNMHIRYTCLQRYNFVFISNTIYDTFSLIFRYSGSYITFKNIIKKFYNFIFDQNDLSNSCLAINEKKLTRIKKE